MKNGVLYSGHLGSTLARLDVTLAEGRIRATVTSLKRAGTAGHFEDDVEMSRETIEEAVSLLFPDEDALDRLKTLRHLCEVIEPRLRRLLRTSNKPETNSVHPNASPIGVPITRANFHLLPEGLSTETRERIAKKLGLDPKTGKPRKG